VSPFDESWNLDVPPFDMNGKEARAARKRATCTKAGPVRGQEASERHLIIEWSKGNRPTPW